MGASESSQKLTVCSFSQDFLQHNHRSVHRSAEETAKEAAREED